MAMIRGTTPTHIFETDIDLSDADVIYVTYEQNDTVVIEKEKSELSIAEKEISLTLSQEETLRFNTSSEIKIQIRVRFIDGLAVASSIITTDAHEILKEGVI